MQGLGAACAFVIQAGSVFLGAVHCDIFSYSQHIDMWSWTCKWLSSQIKIKILLILLILIIILIPGYYSAIFPPISDSGSRCLDAFAHLSFPAGVRGLRGRAPQPKSLEAALGLGAVRKSIFHQPDFFYWHSSCTRVLRGLAATTIIISSIILILILLFLLLLIIIIVVIVVITIVTNKTGTGDGWRTASFGGSSCQRTYRRRYQDHIVSWDHHHSRRSCFPHLNLLGKQKSLAFLVAVSGDTWNCLSEMERINSGDPDGSPSIKKSPKQRGILQNPSVNI